MAQITHRINLAASIFPMTLAKSGRSVINPQTDQNYARPIDPSAAPGSAGIPQAIYMENVLPTPDGYQSVHYNVCTSIAPDKTISAMASVKLATLSTTIDETGNIDDLDEGDTLELWTRSPTFINNSTSTDSVDDTETVVTPQGFSTYTEVIETSAIGNPPNSYRLGAMRSENIFDQEFYFQAYMYRNYNLAQGTETTVSWDVMFRSGTSDATTVIPEFTKLMYVGIGNNADGTGIKILYNSDTGNLSIGTQTAGGWQGSSSAPIFNLALALNYEEFYSFECVITLNENGSRSVLVTVLDDTDTLIATLPGIIPSTVPWGNYVGIVLDSPAQDWGNGGDEPVPNSSPEKVYYDNIHVISDVPDISNTIIAGLAPIYLAFFDDGTVEWSLDLDTWDGEEAVLPGTYDPPLEDYEITTATVRGVGYLCIRTGGETKIYVMSLDIGTNTLTFVDISATIALGLVDGNVLNDIRGIVGSFNYLILYSAATIFWSSTTTPTDFLYSLVSGAGSELPGNLKGDITFCKEHVDGFFIYSTRNVLFAQYTGNARYPWKFREVRASGGYEYSTQVAGDTNSGEQLGINTAKLIQVLDPTKAALMAPEISDYLERGQTYDIFNYSTNVFTVGEGLGLTTDKLRIYMYLDRYVIIPMVVDNDDIESYNYAIVYDVLLARHGKIRHSFNNVLTTDSNIYFVNYGTGAVNKLSFDIEAVEEASANSVLVLGKFQYVRNNLIQIEEVEVESTSIITDPANPFGVVLLPALDGKTFNTPVPLTSKLNTGELIVYPAHTVGKNVSIVLKGCFNLASIVITFCLHGGR